MPIYGQFLHQGAPVHAEIEGEIAHFIADLFGNPTRTGESLPLSKLEILPPVFPSKLFAIGLNYAAHAREHGNDVPAEPLMWFKAPSSLLAQGGTIEIAFADHRTDFEAELAIVIGKRGKAISQAEAPAHILGFCAAQDVSDRTIQRGESQWARAKSLDTYTPLGPFHLHRCGRRKFVGSKLGQRRSAARRQHARPDFFSGAHHRICFAGDNAGSGRRDFDRHARRRRAAERWRPFGNAHRRLGAVGE